MVAKGLTEEEIVQGKGQLKGQITLSLESPTARMYRAAAVALNPSNGQVLALVSLPGFDNNLFARQSH